MVDIVGGQGQWGRAVIVDDDPALRLVSGLSLAKHSGVEVVGEAGSLAEARKLLLTQRPDVLVLDNELPDGYGVDFLTEVRLLNPATQVVVFTSSDVDVNLVAGRAVAVVRKTGEGVADLCRVVDQLRPASPVWSETALPGVADARRSGAADLIRARR